MPDVAMWRYQLRHLAEHYSTKLAPLAAAREVGPAPSSQHPGVSWSKSTRNWKAYVWDGKKRHYLGAYDKECDAAEAVWQAKEDPAEIQAIRATAKQLVRAAQERDSPGRYSEGSVR